MPTMMEIYQNHAQEYDELVTHEDVQNNLGQWLMQHVDWKDKTVCEAGAGTGRITSLYIKNVKKAYVFDRSANMLSALRNNLLEFQNKIVSGESQHTEISLIEKADIFIEGWAFGHAVIENSERVKETIVSLDAMIKRVLKEDGVSIIIETLGTNVTTPKPPHELLAAFYYVIENEFGYQKHIVSTDYSFPSVEEASRIMGFFFGDDVREKILAQGKNEVVEFTGVWVRRDG